MTTMTTATRRRRTRMARGESRPSSPCYAKRNHSHQRVPKSRWPLLEQAKTSAHTFSRQDLLPLALVSKRHLSSLDPVGCLESCMLNSSLPGNRCFTDMSRMFIAILVYLGGGCVYQRTVMNQRGWRQLPNYSMWAGIFGFLVVWRTLISLAKQNTDSSRTWL